jgi:aromatic-amino-acid transaminase
VSARAIVKLFHGERKYGNESSRRRPPEMGTTDRFVKRALYNNASPHTIPRPMNAPLPASLFGAVDLAPRDPILGVTEAFANDPNPRKVNLGVGIYVDDNGKIPLLDCVQRAERQMADSATPRGYLPIDGIAAYDRSVQRLLFGNDSEIIALGRAVTVQALGGTGGLKVGADFLRRFAPAPLFISDPSWENHRALFEGAGFEVKPYPYYDPATHGLDFAAMRTSLEKMQPGSIVVLHACCHNPTGVDPTLAQWDEIIAVVRSRGLVPFLDLAYQGFGDGIDADAAVVRRFAATPGPVFVSNSFSKSFSLYGERVGALTVVTADKDEAARVLSQLKRVVRANYSNPPTHGGRIVSIVMDTPELREIWEMELGGMRERIREMRDSLVKKLAERAPHRDFDFVRRQRGMFSYSGLDREQVRRLRDEYAIYAVDTGRICVAALNSKNIEYVADAIGTVVA